MQQITNGTIEINGQTVTILDERVRDGIYVDPHHLETPELQYFVGDHYRWYNDTVKEPRNDTDRWITRFKQPDRMELVEEVHDKAQQKWVVPNMESVEQLRLKGYSTRQLFILKDQETMNRNVCTCGKSGSDVYCNDTCFVDAAITSGDSTLIVKDHEQEPCTHEALDDTGVGFYVCKACKKSWTYEEWAKYNEAQFQQVTKGEGSQPKTIHIKADDDKDPAIASELILHVLSEGKLFVEVNLHNQIAEQFNLPRVQFMLEGIDRDGLVDFLSVPNKSTAQEWHDQLHILHLEDRIKELEASNQSNVQGWVKAEDRLPETSDNYLVAGHEDYVLWFNAKDSIFQDYHGDEAYPTHWMPLPSPPQQ